MKYYIKIFTAILLFISVVMPGIAEEQIVMTLNHNDSAHNTVVQNGVWTDPGATAVAMDMETGVITYVFTDDAVITHDIVDTSVLGIHTVMYITLAGHEILARITRQVTVVPPQSASPKPPQKVGRGRCPRHAKSNP